MLERWRRRVLVAILLYAVALLVWAARPWTDTQPLAVPEGSAEVVVDVRCPAILSKGQHPEPQDPLPYPPADRPCEQRRSLQALTAVDLAMAGVAVVVLVRAGRRRRVGLEADDDEEAPAAVPE